MATRDACRLGWPALEPDLLLASLGTVKSPSLRWSINLPFYAGSAQYIAEPRRMGHAAARDVAFEHLAGFLGGEP